MVAETLKVVITAETANAVRELRNAENATNKTENSTRKLIGTLAKSAAGFAAAALSVRALVSITRESIQLAGVQERAERSLEAALAATGDTSESTARELREYAAELQNITTFGDEATIAAAALFTQVSGLSAQVTRNALPAIQDFAAAMGMDLQQAASLVGRSIGSTTNALTRYGIQIEEGLEGTERADAILEQITTRFGGFSEAVADTASGSMVQFQNALGDLKEVGGQAILDFIRPSVAGLTEFAARITTAIDEAQNLRDILEGEPTDLSLFDQQLLVAQRIAEIEDQLGRQRSRNRANLEAELEILRERSNRLDAQVRVEQTLAGLSAQEARGAAARQQAEAEAEAARIRAAEAAEHADEQRRLALTKEKMAVTAAAEAYDAMAAAADAAADAPDPYRAMVEVSREAYEVMGEGAAEAARKMEDEAEVARNAWAATFSDIGNRSLSVFSAISSLADRTADNQIAAQERLLENDNLTADERERIESQISNMKRKAALEAFNRDKALQLASIGINTASAFVEALPNPVLAAGVAALGATQAAIVAGTPPPAFEKGGSFVTSGPQMIMVGDGQSPRERVTVEPLSGPYRAGGSVGLTININGAIGGKEQIAMWVQEGLRRAQARGAA